MKEMNDLNAFFTDYGESAFDPERTLGFYGDFAVASTPSFVGCLRGAEEMAAAFSQVADGQRRTGLIGMKPGRVDATELDAFHLLVKVQWNAQFEKTGDQVIEFDVSYVLRRMEKGFQILLYISHQDEVEMRRELGILTSPVSQPPCCQV